MPPTGSLKIRSNTYDNTPGSTAKSARSAYIQSASSKRKSSPCPRKETDLSQVTQITPQEGAARSPRSKGKVPWNEEEHKMRQLQACRHKPLLILPCLCSCSRNSSVWELPLPSAPQFRQLPGPQSFTLWTRVQEGAYQLLPCYISPFLLLASFLCQAFQKPFHILIMQAPRTIAAAGPWGQASE